MCTVRGALSRTRPATSCPDAKYELHHTLWTSFVGSASLICELGVMPAVATDGNFVGRLRSVAVLTGDRVGQGVNMTYDTKLTTTAVLPAVGAAVELSLSQTPQPITPIL
jgi:hypothetical protein